MSFPKSVRIFTHNVRYIRSNIFREMGRDTTQSKRIKTKDHERISDNIAFLQDSNKLNIIGTKDVDSNDTNVLEFIQDDSGDAIHMYNDENGYKKKYFEFLIQQGLCEEQDLQEQYEFLQKSYKIMYDPDDPYGKRLPFGHPGRKDENDINNDYTEKELYYGKNFYSERMEFDHFNKSFILDSVPAYPDKQIHHSPNNLISKNRGIETGLYLPHVTQQIPQWTLKKKISKTYGPGYINFITIPSMNKLPKQKEFQSVLRQYIKEKKWKYKAVSDLKSIYQKFLNNSDEMKAFLDDNVNNKKDYGILSRRYNNNKQIGVGSPWIPKKRDLISRFYETWDLELCYKLKTDGDPEFPKEFKDQVFREYVTNIDKNSSMASWQKNYAFSLLPQAFGGPNTNGDLIDDIKSKLKPKTQKTEYILRETDPIKRKQNIINKAIHQAKTQQNIEIKGFGF